MRKIVRGNKLRKLTRLDPGKLIQSDLRREKASGSAPVYFWMDGWVGGWTDVKAACGLLTAIKNKKSA